MPAFSVPGAGAGSHERLALDLHLCGHGGSQGWFSQNGSGASHAMSEIEERTVNGADFYDRQGRPIPFERYAELMAGDGCDDYRVVARDSVGVYTIWTIWVGLDYSHGFGPPLIFETTVFTIGEWDRWHEPVEVDRIITIDQRRYSTEAEAVAGHEETVTLIRSTMGIATDLPDQRSDSE